MSLRDRSEGDPIRHPRFIGNDTIGMVTLHMKRPRVPIVSYHTIRPQASGEAMVSLGTIRPALAAAQVVTLRTKRPVAQARWFGIERSGALAML